MTIHECPMCATDFDGNTCPSNCPMATGCNMVRCPRCGHEFVDEGMVASFVKNLLERIKHGASQGSEQ